MKLKDIFNIDLSTRGGVKLYRKIMGKYNIPKQDSKQLVKEIRNSSEGGGVKEYYYKCIQSLDNVMRENILLWTNNIEVISHYQEAFFKCSNILPVVDGGLYAAIGFKFLDIPTKALIPSNNNENLIPIEFNGNLNKRAIDYCTKLDFTQEQFENALSAMNNYLKEITKEEYESMITYKPE